jgi:chaperonin cofactor prefoldin
MFDLRKVLLLALFVAVAPASLAAQQRAPAPGGSVGEAQLEQWVTELQELHARLEQIQARALEDEALRSEQGALGDQIRTAMQQADPQLPGLMERMQQLETQAAGAQRAGDEAAFQRLAQEAQQIQARFADAQMKAFEQPAIATRLEAFQTRLETRMAQIDPQAPRMVERFQQLEKQLDEAVRGAARP